MLEREDDRVGKSDAGYFGFLFCAFGIEGVECLAIQYRFVFVPAKDDEVVVWIDHGLKSSLKPAVGVKCFLRSLFIVEVLGEHSCATGFE